MELYTNYMLPGTVYDTREAVVVGAVVSSTQASFSVVVFRSQGFKAGSNPKLLLSSDSAETTEFRWTHYNSTIKQVVPF